MIYLDDHSRRILSIPLVIFVLRSGDRTVVVDTGGPADEEQIRRMIPFGYAVKEADPMENALTRLGVRADDVDLVINPTCTGTTARTTTYSATPRSWSNATNWAMPRRRVRSICGPMGSRQASCRHSLGSQGVRVDTGEGTFVITGDCVGTFGNWNNGGAAMPLPSGRFTAFRAFYASLAHLEGTDWKPLPSHDHTVVEKGTFGY
ncbi:hypothetical protein CJ179_35475 [Rhodococcus sp. ACS1]|nr:hypothetical protein CJ179_35475 [Rhodococcus sp. ACS1]